MSNLKFVIVQHANLQILLISIFSVDQTQIRISQNLQFLQIQFNISKLMEQISQLLIFMILLHRQFHVQLFLIF